MNETWPIGTRETLRDGTIVEVADEVEEGCCKGCFFDNLYGCQAPFSLRLCLPALRDDGIGVIFKKIGHIGG